MLPFSLLNYVLGMTRAPLATFVTASAVGIVPGIALYTYAGAVGRLALGGGDIGPARWGFLVLGLVATGAAIGWLGRRAAMELARARARTG